MNKFSINNTIWTLIEELKPSVIDQLNLDIKIKTWERLWNPSFRDCSNWIKDKLSKDKGE